MKKIVKKIGIDMDDVLMEFGVPLFQFFNNRYGTNFTINDANQFDLDKVWQCDRETAIQAVLDFYNSDLHHEALPTNGSVDFAKNLKSQGAEIFIITARPEKFESVTKSWVNKHFPNIFTDIVFLNHHGAGGTAENHKSKKKSEACRELGIDIFIDDALHNVNDVANLTNAKVFLFDKPWNRNGELHHRVKRIFDWSEVEVS